MTSNIEAIIFDLGRVLIDIDLSRGIFGLFEQDSEDGSVIIAKIMADPAVKLHNAGKISSQEFHRHINEYLKLDLLFEEFRNRWCDIFSPVPEMGKLLEEIKPKVKIGLLSDTDPMHWNYVLSRYDYLKLIPKPTLSYETGTTKPEKEIYLTACKNTGSCPEKTLFIDDLQANVQGAIDAGLQGLIHENPAQTIEKVRQLIATA